MRELSGGTPLPLMHKKILGFYHTSYVVFRRVYRRFGYFRVILFSLFQLVVCISGVLFSSF